MFSRDTNDAIKAHALSTYPEECCGIVDSLGTYRIMENVADDRLGGFRLSPAELSTVLKPLALVHSHVAPRHAPWPTALDMRGQVQMGCTWGITTTDGETASDVLWWGDYLLDEPILGRSFAPGVNDCYSLVRAWYQQMRGIRLPEFPRDADWWERGEDILGPGFYEAGFTEVPRSDWGSGLQIGDLMLMDLRAPVPNHCAIVVENGLMLHHLSKRLSLREPRGPWMKHVVRVGRYV